MLIMCLAFVMMVRKNWRLVIFQWRTFVMVGHTIIVQILFEVASYSVDRKWDTRNPANLFAYSMCVCGLIRARLILIAARNPCPTSGISSCVSLCSILIVP